MYKTTEKNPEKNHGDLLKKNEIDSPAVKL